LLGLFSAECRILAGSFCFDNGKWYSITAQENIVAELVAAIGGGFFGNLEGFNENIILLDHLTRIINVPACLAQSGVDQLYAGLLLCLHFCECRFLFAACPGIDFFTWLSVIEM
jgi:hypothetical protein